MTAPILRSLSELRAMIAPWQAKGARIGIVPTMGALHDGHLSLVETAKKNCDHVIVTIFVNPMQFNNADDLENYPRTEHDDARKLERFNIDALYVPDGPEMYPEGFATTVTVAGLTDVLCGTHRPGHFDGVATVVAKLFLQSAATDAYFGEKDYQQLQIVRRMASDLDIAITVHGCTTIREIDGLAMSSRNLLLSDRARVKAPALNGEMERIAGEMAKGKPFSELQDAAIKRIENAGFTKVEYLEVRANDTLELLDTPTRPARLLAAAWLAGVRLIDNIAIEP